MRTLTLCDPENEVGGADASIATARRFFQVFFAEVVGFQPGDQLIAGVSHHAAKRWMFDLMDLPIQWRLGSGPDGAERAVLASVDLTHAASAGFGRLIVASGDGAFSATAREARELGMQVHLVTGRGGVSRALRAACPTHSRIREVRRGANRIPVGLRPSSTTAVAA